MKGGLAVSVCVAAAGAVAAAYALSSESGDSDIARETVFGSEPPHAHVRGCRDRVEGVATIRPRRGRDTVIGPLAFIGLPVTYRDFSSRPSRELEADPRVGTPSMKAVVWLRAGARVTVVVPEEQRAWMRLRYERPKRRGVHAITFQACRTLSTQRARRRECGWGYRACRRGYTEFNGGIAVDFEKAPERARCAELTVWIDGGERSGRKPVFGPRPNDC